MTSKIILGIVIVGALVFGVYSMRRDAVPIDDTVAEQGETATQDEQASSGKKMAFNVFLEQDKGSYVCTVKQYFEQTDSEGTVYISEGKVRGDFVTTVANKEVKTSFLVKDGYQYLWTSPLASGFKMKIPAQGGSMENQAGMSGTYAWNAEQIGDYNCTPWTPDTATFTLPSGMMFAEITQPAPQLE